MSKFDEFFDLLKKYLVDEAKKSWDDAFDAVKNFGEAFFHTIKDDLDKWTQALAEGKLTQEELDFLIKSKKELMKLQLLTEAGLTKARIEKLQNTIINVTVKTALDVFK
ncbi:hypothetical protein JXA70_05170 [candidate division KSB1 bacterium]|nr:hypothetical protein [candidate division KSB1 bacterium]